MSLKCYMLELIMVLDEEEIEDQATKCIISFNEFLQPPNVSSVYKSFLKMSVCSKNAILKEYPSFSHNYR